VYVLVCEQYEVGCHLVGHTESVTAVDALYMAQQLLIVSASADCSLRIWLRRERSEGKRRSKLLLVVGFDVDNCVKSAAC